MIFVDANLLIYLNLGVEEIVEFFGDLLLNHTLCTDVLVLDETIYISWKKYRIPFQDTANFLSDIILPYVRILSLGRNEYIRAEKLLSVLKPSDALHVAAMLNNGVKKIASEDQDFDKIKGIKRVWITTLR